MLLSDCLKAARAKIENPENWCQVDMARNSAGIDVDPRTEEACMFCSYGAVSAVSNYDGKLRKAADEKLRAAAQELYGCGVITVNDTRFHEDVLKMFDKAIENANS